MSRRDQDVIDDMLHRLDEREAWLDRLSKEGRIPNRDYLRNLIGVLKYREKFLRLKKRLRTRGA